MGKVVSNLTGGLIGSSDAERAAKEAKRRAAEERQHFEAEMEKQRQAALLESSNKLENVTQVEVGGSAAGTADAFTAATKRKRKGVDSSSLGIM